jgi:hypothetical protein
LPVVEAAEVEAVVEAAAAEAAAVEPDIQLHQL